MAKRLTDTEKWKDDWYISLSNDDKIVWQWLLDNCNHAGFCKKSLAMLNLMCRVNYTEDELLKKMDERVLCIKNYWFIPKFIKFQYTTLLSSKPVIVSVVKDLFLMGCEKMVGDMFGNDYKIISESFNNHYQMIKDKDKDKDKRKDKDIDIKEKGYGEKPLKGSKAVKISDDGEFAIFENGYMQKLGNGQKREIEDGFTKANHIILDSIY